MIEQNGQAVTTVSAPVACSCLNRTSLMRDARLLFLVGEQQSAAGAAAVRVLAIPLRLVDVGAESRQQLARLVHFAGVASEVAGIVERARSQMGV